MEIEELREILGIEKEKLQRYIHFKQKVLDIAEKKINENTDIKININPIKTIRKITSIEFIISKNENYYKNKIEKDFKIKDKLSEKAKNEFLKKQLKKEKEEEEKERAREEKAKIENEKALEIFNKMTNEEKEKYRVDYNKLSRIVKKVSFNHLYDNYVLARIKEKF